ncbi:unnamed protein product [Pleuronectes platessa]|uniref:Uncharacterized protein n=1 Tax=Pleuronectes platessa TaxID=8262 RepID=A0A9N7YL89_PLEPL|nr:unnamed protein product [Pleuronectes platessa]
MDCENEAVAEQALTNHLIHKVPRSPPSFPPPLLPPHLGPTSEERTASRVSFFFLPYKISSRGANRSTPISAIISDSNYLQIYRQEERRRSRTGPKNKLEISSYLRGGKRNFYAPKLEELERLRCALPASVSIGDNFCCCAPLLRSGGPDRFIALTVLIWTGLHILLSPPFTKTDIILKWKRLYARTTSPPRDRSKKSPITFPHPCRTQTQ